jgi:probable HAF family extracellular repeat protein
MKDIHSATLFPFGTTATGINSLGQVVGYGWTTSANSHPFLFTGTAMIDLGTSGGPDGTALAISDAGQVVGNLTALNGSSHGFLYANGTMVDLGVPSGATSSTANAINVHSRIVGTLTVGGSSHAASWSGGVWTDLGVLPGATLGTMATGINASGQIVGVAIFPAIYARHGGRGITHVGFIILNGAPVDLDTLIPAGSGFTITGATAINDSGDILCNAISSSKSFRAVLLTPR